MVLLSSQPSQIKIEFTTILQDQIGEFLGNVLTSNNNNMPQRNDLSDADETDIKKKKRKRSISRDSSEMSKTSTTGKRKSPSQASTPRKSQKVASSDAGKNVIKIPVGGQLGALTNVSRNLNQPSPAKKPRTSKSKSKTNSQTSTSGGTRTSDVSGVPIPASRRALIQGIPISASATSVPASMTPPTGQGFISLAAKGSSVIKPAVSQSYLTMSGVGAPSIIKTGSGSVQYIIKPQSQRHIPVPIGMSVPTGAVNQTSSSAAQAASSVSSSGIRYTSLAQSPTSPFTSILSLKGQNNTGTPQGVTAATAAITKPVISMSSPSLALSAATTGARVLSTGGTTQQSEAMKKVTQGKPFVSQVFTSLPQHMVSSSGMTALAQLSSASTTTKTTPSTSHINTSQLSSTAHSHLLKSTNVSQAISATVNPSQQSSVVQMSSSKPVQITSSRPVGNPSQIRYIVGSPSTSQAASSLQGTVQGSAQGNFVRTVAGSLPGRSVSQVATVAKASPQVLTSQQISNIRALSASTPGSASQQRASPSTTTQGAAQSTRIQNLSGKGALTRTFVLTTASATGVRSSSPQTSTSSPKPQVYKPGITAVTHVLTSSSRSATGSPKPQGNVTQTLTPASVMLKGGTVVSMQSLLARLPHGTKVITSNSSDGNGNVYVVGNVLTQVQNPANRPKTEVVGPKPSGSTAAAGNASTKATAPLKGTVISVSIPTSTVQGTAQTPHATSQAARQPSKPMTSQNVTQSKDGIKQISEAVSTSMRTEGKTEKPKDAGTGSQK